MVILISVIGGGNYDKTYFVMKVVLKLLVDSEDIEIDRNVLSDIKTHLRH